jgi:hypothetical protein
LFCATDLISNLVNSYEAADCGLLSADLAAGIRRVKGVKKCERPEKNNLSGPHAVRFFPRD